LFSHVVPHRAIATKVGAGRRQAKLAQAAHATTPEIAAFTLADSHLPPPPDVQPPAFASSGIFLHNIFNINVRAALNHWRKSRGIFSGGKKLNLFSTNIVQKSFNT
jgi:hypothetical protein